MLHLSSQDERPSNQGRRHIRGNITSVRWYISSIYSKKPLFLVKRTPQNGEKGHSHPIRRQNSRLRTGKYFENISDIWKKCKKLDLCLFMFEKYTSERAEARIKLLYVCQSITHRLDDVSN